MMTWSLSKNCGILAMFHGMINVYMIFFYVFISIGNIYYTWRYIVLGNIYSTWN